MPPSFSQTLQTHGLRLPRTPTEIVQINVGKLCNQVCAHCHVEAGPKRTEVMGSEVVEQIIHLLERSPGVRTIDLTGGAPEMNPHFRTLVPRLCALGKTVLDRCNLTILLEDGYGDLGPFLAKNGVTIIASLPCYSKDNVEKQRGRGVFDKSIEALRLLNSLGYGKRGSGLELSLVYNPIGASLPPAQAKLEADYKRELQKLFGIEFNHLYTITNMPIKRFLWDLERKGALGQYMDLLVQAFNPKTATGVMCRNLVSIGWDGKLYDCDFNQMLEIPVPSHRTVWDLTSFDRFDESIEFRDHCYGCTAGAGSSCGGALL